MPSVSAYVENGVAMASDHGSAAWLFDPGYWGLCGQGSDEASALLDLRRLLGRHVEVAVAERVEGDERAFARDRFPCTDSERQATLSILAETRRQTIELLAS